MSKLSEEQIAKSVESAFHSVNLIKKLNEKTIPLSKEETDRKNRNVEHLKIMMNHDWFKEALSKNETTEIENVIK